MQAPRLRCALSCMMDAENMQFCDILTLTLTVIVATGTSCRQSQFCFCISPAAQARCESCASVWIIER
jgi:hypothetical protein